jgi:hypothetical protein
LGFLKSPSGIADGQQFLDKASHALTFAQTVGTLAIPLLKESDTSRLHKHLHPVGAAIGEQGGVVGPGSTEYSNHAPKGGFGAGAHVQWLNRQPQRIDPDQRNISRSQGGAGRSAAHRPAHADVDRAALQLQFDGLRRIRWRDLRDDRHGDEGGCAANLSVVSSQAPSLVNEIGIEAVAHGHLCHGRAWGRACCDDLALQLCIVTPAAGRLGV